MSFHASSFGLEEAFRWRVGDRRTFAFPALAALDIALGERPPEGGEFALSTDCDDVGMAAECLRAGGAEELLSPTVPPWGGRMCSFHDPAGHLVHVGARRTSGHGT